MNCESVGCQWCQTLCDPARLLCPWDSLGENTGKDCHSLLQGVFPTQGSNPSPLHLLHCRRIFHPLSHGEAPGRLWEVTLSWKGMQYTGGVQSHPRRRASDPGCSTKQEEPFFNQNRLQFAQLGSECMHTSRTGVGLSEMTHDSSRLLRSKGILLKRGL